MCGESCFFGCWSKGARVKGPMSGMDGNQHRFVPGSCRQDKGLMTDGAMKLSARRVCVLEQEEGGLMLMEDEKERGKMCEARVAASATSHLQLQ